MAIKTLTFLIYSSKKFKRNKIESTLSCSLETADKNNGMYKRREYTTVLTLHLEKKAGRKRYKNINITASLKSNFSRKVVEINTPESKTI